MNDVTDHKSMADTSSIADFDAGDEDRYVIKLSKLISVP